MSLASRFHFSVQKTRPRAHSCSRLQQARMLTVMAGSQCRFQANAKDSSNSGRAMAEAAPYHPGRATSCMCLLVPPMQVAWKKTLRDGRRQITHAHNNTKTQCIAELNKACLDKSPAKGCTSVRCWRLRLSVLTLWSSCGRDDAWCGRSWVEHAIYSCRGFGRSGVC